MIKFHPILILSHHEGGLIWSNIQVFYRFFYCVVFLLFSLLQLVHPQISTNRNLAKLWYVSQGQPLISVVNILYTVCMISYLNISFFTPLEASLGSMYSLQMFSKLIPVSVYIFGSFPGFSPCNLKYVKLQNCWYIYT